MLSGINRLVFPGIGLFRRLLGFFLIRNMGRTHQFNLDAPAGCMHDLLCLHNGYHEKNVQNKR